MLTGGTIPGYSAVNKVKKDYWIFVDKKLFLVG